MGNQRDGKGGEEKGKFRVQEQQFEANLAGERKGVRGEIVRGGEQVVGKRVLEGF